MKEGFLRLGLGAAVLITTRQGGWLLEASSSLDRAHYQDQIPLFPLALGSSEVLPGPLGHARYVVGRVGCTRNSTLGEFLSWRHTWWMVG